MSGLVNRILVPYFYIGCWEGSPSTGSGYEDEAETGFCCSALGGCYFNHINRFVFYDSHA